jgi:DNA-binding NarL/FixJ family response regulator
MLVEDDPYARDLMGLLLRRDWRTQVVAETGDISAVAGLLAKMRVDVVLLDTEHPTEPQWAGRIMEAIKDIKKPPLIIVTGTHPNVETLLSLKAPVYTGYLLKGEIAYSLAWAVTLATEGGWVITPRIETLAAAAGFAFPRQPVILDGKTSVTGFTPREAEIARLAILFNLPRRDLADELTKSPATIFESVSQVYEKLGLWDILDGEVDPTAYFSGHDLVLQHFKDSLTEIWPEGKGPETKGRKGHDKDTLAFHLLTIPEIR